MKAYVGVTDGDWYRFLAARPELGEVNFWRPSAKNAFAALAVGEPFFFKTHHPHNRVVGGGFYSGFARLRISEAWLLLGPGNGVSDLDQMRAKVGGYRKEPIAPREDPEIGCVFIRDVTFFPPGGEADPPPEFAPNIVQGKGYALADSAVTGYFQELLRRLVGPAVEGLDLAEPWSRPGPVFGDPRLAPQRLGQRAFQGVVLNAYGGRCSITGDRIRPVLQAAHVRPVTKGGQHRLDNGMLLRSDVHTLFDAGYLGVDTAHRLQVSPRLRTDFGNGEQFYARASEPVRVPDRKPDRPHRDFLEWHMDTIFKVA